MMIFDECKKEGWAPSIINFNGIFLRQEGETQSQAIMGLIYAELRRVDAEDESNSRYEYNEKALDA